MRNIEQSIEKKISTKSRSKKKRENIYYSIIKFFEQSKIKLFFSSLLKSFNVTSNKIFRFNFVVNTTHVFSSHQKIFRFNFDQSNDYNLFKRNRNFYLSDENDFHFTQNEKIDLSNMFN